MSEHVRKQGTKRVPPKHNVFFASDFGHVKPKGVTDQIPLQVLSHPLSFSAVQLFSFLAF